MLIQITFLGTGPSNLSTGSGSEVVVGELVPVVVVTVGVVWSVVVTWGLVLSQVLNSGGGYTVASRVQAANRISNSGLMADR